jgi:long-chain fatty acid transport protein
MTLRPPPLARRPRHLAGLALAALAPLSAQATNGMLLEGYGPVATGMGGASMAVENGAAAATNNPATLGLAGAGSRLDLALGLLGPRVSSRAGPMNADSSGTSYWMPALGYVRGDGRFSWGVALFAQGGMGTEYGADSFLAMGSGQAVRSELGVARVLFPVAWRVNDATSLGASFDLVRATLDLRMAASGAQLAGMVTGAGGNLAMALGPLGGAGWARIDFSDASDFSGQASATGTALKLGIVHRLGTDLRLGASWHSRTRLKDLRTGTTGASMSAEGGFADPGRITVQDFQMPSQWAVGLAWQASPATLVAADVKRIGWAAVMNSLRMRYDSAGMGGDVSFSLPQRWKDQTVLQAGVAHRLASGTTLRAGVNLAGNPVPDETVNPLFPAIVKRHLTAGLGLPWAGEAETALSLAYAPRVTVNTPSGVVIQHRQLNAQLMHSLRF